ncbi:dihydroorotate dehydrogenase [Oceanobacillus polygoni]|uniref:Dihydroorotate dehydrogenase n=1 Tax=Oceanobacillus polygoni TaxID=1235259 RepID=A0A9X0YR98_9BACI|nr:dihydroorotate dehydrogenase [Oceanobacillus polygoni]MBP2076641.1 dihydroorotate dehydrogenase [Oceanobacillus polygoni]
MPDWSYHGIFRPLLNRLPPNVSRELIHRGMSFIATLPLQIGPQLIHFLGREESSPLIHQKKHALNFNSPVGLSGKIDPLLSGTKAFTNLGFGFLEIGPVAVKPSKHFSTPTVDKKIEVIQFPTKVESIGIEKTINQLHKVKKKQPIFVRLIGTRENLSKMIKRFEQYADGYIIEASYPELISETNKPIFFSTASPSENLVDSPFAGIVLEHAEKDVQFLEKVINLRKNGFQGTIITTGGIKEPEQALQLLDAGADFIMLSDGYVFAGPGLTKRINEALLDRLNYNPTHQHGWLAYWLFGLFIMIGGLLALLFSMTTVVLPYDELFLEMTGESIMTFNERIMLFMAHDRMTLAGTMISGGIVYMQLAKHGVKHGLKWAKQAFDIAAIIGFLGIFSFIGFGYFDWLHLIFWLILLPVYVYGYRKTKGVTGTASSKNRKNDVIFKRGVFGQLAFVLLGFSFVLGGIIISIIGMTTIFVPTDLAYICMPAEMMNAFNENLLPVLAHDRAGFGSALLSVGLLVLTLSLWGFQQGNRWVWWTYLIGGLPAFWAGIYIHFAIGYTNFIHLLPAYVALGLYIIGLILTYPFFIKAK